MVDPQTQRNRDMIDTLFAMPIKDIARLPEGEAQNYRLAVESEMRALALLAAVLPGAPAEPF